LCCSCVGVAVAAGVVAAVYAAYDGGGYAGYGIFIDGC